MNKNFIKKEERKIKILVKIMIYFYSFSGLFILYYAFRTIIGIEPDIKKGFNLVTMTILTLSVFCFIISKIFFNFLKLKNE